MKPATSVIEKPHTPGDVLNAVYDVVNTALAKYGLEIYPIEQANRELASCSFEQIVEVLRAVPPAELPQCIHCEGIMQLVPCSFCREWVCMDCAKKYHACNQIDGPSTDQLRG